MEETELTGWQKLCKRYGAIVFNGDKYVWNYETESAVLESEMSTLDVKKSNKAKWAKLKASAK